jgi:predicted esterase
MTTNERVGDIHVFEAGSTGDTLVLLHGTGADERDLLPLGRQLAPGANLLSPRGPVLENGMPRFFRRFSIDRFDEDDIRRRSAELVSFLDHAAERYGFDRSRVTVLGYSNGANLAAAAMLLHGSVVRRAVLWRPVFPLAPGSAPELAGTEVLIASGRQDPYAAVPKVEALASALREGGAGVDLVWSGLGHGLEQRDLDVTAQWLAGASAGR